MSLDFDPSIDHYKVLGVKSDASQNEIKKAYREMAKKYHPDSTGGDKGKEARFKKVSQAYDVLGDSDKRAQYDAVRAGGYAGANPFAGGGQTRRGGRAPGGAHVADISELFAQMFPGGQARASGGFPFGADFVSSQQSPFGRAQARPQAKPTPAPPSERKIKLPDGQRATQRGSDVYADVRLRIDQAILGAVAEVTTLVGTSKVKIPPGTSSGTKLRLKGKGAKRTSAGRGDHFAVIQIDVPKNIDEEAEKLLAQFMQRTKPPART
ncbi:MAG: hypothetical protein Tsb0020_09090 [Haliangiales bacterium]